MNHLTCIRRFCLPFLLLVFVALRVQAQDSLRMRTGAVYAVRVIEISDELVKYRTYSNPDGPLYTVSKSSIQSLKLENRTWEQLNAPVPGTRAPQKTSGARANGTEERTHYIGINLMDLIRTDLTVYYEWMFANGKIGLRVPVTYGFRSGYFNGNTTLANPFRFRRNIVFRTGIDLRVYSGQGYRKVRYVFGPAIYYLRLNRIPSDYGTASPDYMVYSARNAMRLLFFNGIQVRPVDYLQFGFDIGFGGDIDFGEKNTASGTYLTPTPTVPKAQFNLHLGYRF